jgi:hypothetical protein
MLCEGSSMRSVSRITGVSINTVSKLLIDAGLACAAYHDAMVRDVPAKAVHPTSRTLVKSLTPWPVSYDARMVVSLTTLRTDIVGSIYGPSGYLSHLRADGNARCRFARCIKEYASP